MAPDDYLKPLREIQSALTTATRLLQRAHEEIATGDTDYPWDLIDLNLEAATTTLDAARAQLADLRKGNQ